MPEADALENQDLVHAGRPLVHQEQSGLEEVDQSPADTARQLSDEQLMELISRI